LNCNIERDIDTFFVEGSEIPTSFIERRMDLEHVITTYIEAAMPPPEKLLSQYFDLLGLDYDIGGIEADERLADARYFTIKTGLKQLTGTLSDAPTMIPDPMTGQSMEGPSPLIQAVMSHPQLRVLPKETHQVSIDFYVERETAIMAQDMPDMHLIDCLEEMIRRHEAKGVEDAQTQNAMGVAAQAPLMQAAQEMAPAEEPQPDPAQEAQAQADLESQKQQAEAQQKGEDRDFEAADKQAQRQHEMDKLDKEHAFQTQQKQLDLISAERVAQMQAKEKAKQQKDSKAA